MTPSEILAVLKSREPDLRAMGVRHAALFGSRARGDHRPDSDIDILVDIDPDAPIGVYEYVGIKLYIAKLFEGPVDVVDRHSLKPRIRPNVVADAVDAF